MTELELIRKSKSGDNQALDELIQMHLPAIYRLSMSYLKNEADAEDATQDTFVKVWRNLKRFDETRNLAPYRAEGSGSGFQAWAMTIAKNTCLDILKKNKVIPLDFVSETLESDSPSPADLTNTSLIKTWLNKALDHLSPKYQEILKLYYYQELNLREISETLNIPINTVKSQHRRALIVLKKTLDEI